VYNTQNEDKQNKKHKAKTKEMSNTYPSKVGLQLRCSRRVSSSCFFPYSHQFTHSQVR